MAANLQNTISAQRDSSGETVIRKWLVVFGELYSREISQELIKTWLKLTSHYPSAKLDVAFKKLSQTFVPTSACPFPVPAQLAEQFTTENSAVDFAAMNAAWQKLDERMMGYKYESMPWTTQELFCIRAAGGFNALVQMTFSEFQWAKKRFCEAWTRWNEMPEEAKALPSPEVSKLIEENYKPKNLPPSEFEQFTIRKSARTYPTLTSILSEEEFEKRKKFLAEQQKKITGQDL